MPYISFVNQYGIQDKGLDDMVQVQNIAPKVPF